MAKATSCRMAAADRVFLAASFLSLAAIMYYFVFMTPYMADSYVFSRDISPGFAEFYRGADITARPMTVEAAFRHASDMYHNWNGRYTGNLAVYLLFMLPHWLYSLLVAVLFGIYLFLMQLCVFGRQWRQNISAGWTFALAGLLWAGLPSFGEAFFWLSVGGMIALLGQAAIFLPFRFALDGLSPDNGFLRQAVCSLILGMGGMAVASLDYATSAVMPVTTLACSGWIIVKQRKIPWPLLTCSLGLCVGSYLTLCAPGNHAREILTLDPEVHAFLARSWGQRIWMWLLHLPGAAVDLLPQIVLSVFACHGLWRLYGKNWILHIPPAAWLFLCPCMLTYGAYIFTAWPPPRAFSTCAAQLVMAACILYAAIVGKVGQGRLFRILRGSLCLFCVVTVSYEAMQFYQLHEDNKRRESIIMESADGVAVLPPLSVASDSWQVLGRNVNDISANPEFWVNRGMSAFYGIPGVVLAEPALNYAPPQKKERNASVRINLEKGRLIADMGRKNMQDLHVYYHGDRGLLALFPDFMANPVYQWLAKAKKGTWALKLVPLLCARADISASTIDQEHGLAQSIPLRLRQYDTIWLVEPGSGKYSFNLLPLHGSVSG